MKQRAHLDAIRLAESLRHRLLDLNTRHSAVRDAELRRALSELWASEEGVVGDLWVEGMFPSQPSVETLRSLVEAGLFDSELAQLLERVFPLDRPLFAHQNEAIRRSVPDEQGGNPALVISAGTGAGKTESFLLPVLNRLWTSPPKHQGIRCLILYPMNALVNDQVDRIQSWLSGQDRVTLFHFTSETPEEISGHDPKLTDAQRLDPCRFWSRNHARGLENRQRKKRFGARGETPGFAGDGCPSILVTNYSMLEYMLCRPQDAGFFGRNLEAVILDEAHLYSGTLAAEITMLLRRLLLRCDRDPREVLQIATSATIGRREDGDLEGQLAKFGKKLFSCPKTKSVVGIVGEQQGPADPDFTFVSSRVSTLANLRLEAPCVELSVEGEATLSINGEECRRLRGVLQDLEVAVEGVESEEAPARVLATTLKQLPEIKALHAVMWNRGRPTAQKLTAVASTLFGGDSPLGLKDPKIQATLALLEVGASGRSAAEELPVVPHRLHVLVRAAEGAQICMDPFCNAPESSKPVEGLGGVQRPSGLHCQYCGGKVLTLVKCADCLEWALAYSKVDVGDGMFEAATDNLIRAGGVELGIGRPNWPEGVEQGLLQTHMLDTNLGITFEHESSTLQELIPAAGKSHPQCPCCGSNEWRTLGTPTQIALPVAAEAALAATPPLASRTRNGLPCLGRRLLAFSDSRADAARLGPRLMASHEIQLMRVAAWAKLPQADGSKIQQLMDLREQLRQAGVSTRAIEQELASAHGNSTLASLLDGLAKPEDPDYFAMFLDQETAILQQPDGDFSALPPLSEETESVDREETEEVQEESNGLAPVVQENRKKVRSKVRRLLLREFSRPGLGTGPDVQSVGLVEVTYAGLESLIPPSTHPLAKVGPTLSDFVSILIDLMRKDGLSTMMPDGVTEDSGNEWFRWREANLQLYIGFHLCKNQERGQTSKKPFLPAPGKENQYLRFAKRYLASLDVDGTDAARILLDHVFEELYKAAKAQLLPWLIANEEAEVKTLQIRLDQLGVRRPKSLWVDDEAHFVITRTANGLSAFTERELVSTDEEDLLAKPLIAPYRVDIMEGGLVQSANNHPHAMALWSEEHSAQLSSVENKRLQLLFKEGKRNVLSSTTTMELGIDIGGLSAVFLGNVPPGKASYLQRAGRAGRRSDGSAAVIAFCRPNPFDRRVFRDFGWYVSQPLRRPTVLLQRDVVVKRQIHAWLLNEFYRSVRGQRQINVGAMGAYRNMGWFMGQPKPVLWRDEVEEPRWETIVSDLPSDRGLWPEWVPRTEASAMIPMEQLFRMFLRWAKTNPDLNLLYKALATGTALDGPEESSTLAGFIGGSDGNQRFGVYEAFERATSAWKETYVEIAKQWQERAQIPISDDDRPARKRFYNAIYWQLKQHYETHVIEAMADAQFLPSYGFPINVLKLHVRIPTNLRGQEDKLMKATKSSFRLERPGMYAISEYAPGAKRIVGGRVIRSRGILRHWSGEAAAAGQDVGIGVEYSYGRMMDPDTGESRFVYSAGNQLDCAKGKLLLVKHGFSTASYDKPRWRAEDGTYGESEIALDAEVLDSEGEALEQGVGQESELINLPGVRGVRASFRSSGELIALNMGKEHGYAVCLACGHADAEKQKVDGNSDRGLPDGFEDHPKMYANSKRDVCWSGGTRPVRRNLAMAAKTSTHTLTLLIDSPDAASRSARTTAAVALLIAGARLLELDSRQLGYQPSRLLGKPAMMFFDTEAGGVGHVLELQERAHEWFKAARDQLWIDEQHDLGCDKCCLQCLIGFGTSRYERLLDRRSGLRLIESALQYE